MKKLVITYGIILIVVLSLSAVNTFASNRYHQDGQEEVVFNTSALYAAINDSFSLDATPVKKAIPLFNCDFPNCSLYIDTTPTFTLSPELLASSEKGIRAFSRYSSELKI